MKEIKSVKFIALRDFSLGEFDCGDDIKAEDIVFIDYKEEPDIKAGEIIEIEDYRDELTDSEIEEDIKFIKILADRGYMMLYADYRNQRIEDILNDE